MNLSLIAEETETEYRFFKNDQDPSRLDMIGTFTTLF